MELQKRKPNRLSYFDYSTKGYYFVTICTANRQEMFGKIVDTSVGACITRPKTIGQEFSQPVGECIARPKTNGQEFSQPVGACIARPQIQLSNCGKIVEQSIKSVCKKYDEVYVDRFVIMPNHLHLIIVLNNGRAMHAPTVSNIIGQMKSYVTKQFGVPIWQRSFYDHIIRDKDDYLRISEYIEKNPANWANDRYFVSDGHNSPI